MKMEPTVDDMLHCLIVDGTIIAKKRWEVYWTYVTRLVPKVSPQSIIEGRVEHDVQYDYIRRERCVLDLKPLERVYLPFEGGVNEDALDHIIEEVWYTMADLRELQFKGLIPKRINLEDLKGEMDKLEEFSGTKLERMNAEGSVPVNTRKEAYKIKCYEACLKYAVATPDDPKGEQRKDIIVLMAAKPKKWLAGKPLHAVSRIGKRPWIIRAFLRRPGRIYGKSIPELVRWLHKEMNAIHNQRIDAGNMAIAPYFFYRAHSGTQPKTITVGPATGVPLDEPQRDVSFPKFPNFGLQIGFQEERIVMEMIERLTFLTPAMMGKELASRPTVRGTLAVMSQGEQKFSLLARRVQYIICDTLSSIKQSYEENMPPDMQARILGKEGNPIFANLSPETIAGQYDAKMQLDLSAGNIGMERELNTIMMQTMAMDPFVIQNPAYGWEIRKDYLTSLNKRNVERFIGPKPPTEVGPEEAESIYYQIAQGKTMHPPLNIDAKLLSRLIEIRNSGAFDKLTEESKVLFVTYIQEAKIAYAQAMQERMAQYVNANGTAGFTEGGGGAGGFAQTPGMGGPQGAGSPGPAQPGGRGGVPVGGPAAPGQPGAVS
jgi:hypothetical protein